jgi:hypothetical protein
MRKIQLGIAATLALGAISVVAIANDRQDRRGGSSALPSVQPSDFGIVEAPSAGSTRLRLEDAPPALLHSARVVVKEFDAQATITGVQLDKDDVIGVYEFQARASDGTLLEADILPNGSVEELEIVIPQSAVPSDILNALHTFAPEFEFADPATEPRLIEKSIRPSALGLSTIWYEFSGRTFDVEIRSDAKGIFIEPA